MKKKVFLVVAILIIIVIILFQNTSFFQNENITTRYDKIDINSGEEVYTYKNIIYVYGKGGLKIYENTKQIFSESFSLENPYFVYSNDKIIIGDKYGKILRVYNSKDNIYTINHPNSIISATVNKNGYSALIAKNNSSYEILVYDEVGNKIFAIEDITYKEGIPINLTLSNDNNSLAISFLKTEGAIIETNIAIYSLTSDTSENNSMVSAFTKQDQMAGIIKFLDKQNLLILSDKEFSVVSVKENIKQVQEIVKLVFNNKIDYISFLGNSSFVLIYGEELMTSQENKIEPNTAIIYNYGGGKVGQIQFKNKNYISNIFSNEYGFVVSQDRLFTGYSNSGTKEFEYQATQDIKYMNFFSSKDKAIIVTENEIRILKLNQKNIKSLEQKEEKQTEITNEKEKGEKQTEITSEKDKEEKQTEVTSEKDKEEKQTEVTSEKDKEEKQTEVTSEKEENDN